MNAYVLAVCTALVWGLVPVFEKMGLARLSAPAGIFIRCLAVFSGSLVLLSFKPGILAEVRQTPVKYILLIAGGGFVANFLGQLLFYHALKSGQVSRVVPIAGAYPLVAFLMGLLFLGEKLTLVKSLGMGCVVLGLFLLR